MRGIGLSRRLVKKEAKEVRIIIIRDAKVSLSRGWITVGYKIGIKLVGNRTAKTRFEEIEMTESKFADDAALYAVTRQAVERIVVACNNGRSMKTYC